MNTATTQPAHTPSPTIPWHTFTLPALQSELKTDMERGLHQADAVARLNDVGHNELTAGERISPFKLFFGQFANFLMIILIVGIVLSVALGHMVEAITISVIVLFSTILGFIQEYRAERAIDALQKMSAPTATVIRGGEEEEIPARDVVPGDLVLLSAGDRVPADARVAESINMQADEAALTGESLPVTKMIDPLSDVGLSVGDRINMLYAGTVITYGRGSAIVTSTGMRTEFGQIAGLLQTMDAKVTPLQKNLEKLGKILAIAAVAIIVIIVGLGVARGQNIFDMVLFGIALAVAVVPEALPAVVTISLALGVQRMVKRNALVRRLPAVETLGSTSVICTDKTGTLTRDEMTVRCIYANHTLSTVTGSGYDPNGEFQRNGVRTDIGETEKELLRGATLASDAHLFQFETTWDIKGDPTEGAMVVAAAKAGLRKHELDETFPRTAEIPFTSETKRMVTLHHMHGVVVAYAKGAPEVILEDCVMERTDKGDVPMDEKRREEILAEAQRMAGQALRVLAVAKKEHASLENASEQLTFLGLFGMIDPARPEVKAAMATCKVAGIRTIMITGDHPVTASAIAHEIGLTSNTSVITGKELDTISEDDLVRLSSTVDVYARVSPVHKLSIVSALQSQGQVVAMTGDGVNDAPALKKADIGIAMGITGTDVSKEAADMMLTDDNFASIVAAVEEGRIIFGNIRKYLMYLISANIAEIFIMTIASVLGWPLPLSAVQILYINLATDGLPALALALDPPEHDLMKRKPRDQRRSIFTRPVLFLILTSSIWATIITVGLFWWLLTHGASETYARSMTFSLLVLTEFFKAYNFRSDHITIFKKPFANKWLNLAIVWEVILLAIIFALPILQRAFGLDVPTLNGFLVTLVLAATIIPVVEIAKWVVRRWMHD